MIIEVINGEARLGPTFLESLDPIVIEVGQQYFKWDLPKILDPPDDQLDTIIVESEKVKEFLSFD